MKRTIYIIIIAILFLCITTVDASSIDYNLTIDDHKTFHESITYVIEDSTTNSYLLNVLNNTIYFDTDNIMPYQKSVINNGNNVVVILKQDYESTAIKKSKLLNECFKDFTYEENEYRITYYAESPFKCTSHADKITISVNTDIPSIIDTADEVIGNKYTWNKIDKDFMMDLSLGEHDPNSDVLPPVADDDEPIDDSGEFVNGDLDLFPYTEVIIGSSIAVTIVVITTIIIIKKKKAKNRRKNKEDVYYDE